MMKKEIRIIGIDDSAFAKFSKGKVLVVGAVMRGGNILDGILSTKVEIDGDDSTSKLTEMINKSRFKAQLRCIFLDGIALAGFNVVDINELNRKTGIPVVTIIRKYPDFNKIKETLARINMQHKIKLIENAGEPVKIGKIFVQIAGINTWKLKEILKLACTRSHIPEPLRLAHLIATGVVKGESRGRA
ncbi:DUF99 family protein [Candidatus Woesearchaeota archaeon]|nr:DUF99 family protein [Candidatus Woesearchaeota archaeon]